MALLLRSGPWEHGEQAPIFHASGTSPGRADEQAGPAAMAPTPMGGFRAEAERALAAAAAAQPRLNIFTTLFSDQVRADADRATGEMAGMTAAVKDLFDVREVVTLAGSRAYRSSPPARRDATAVGRLRGAGALIVGATNMDEFAYGFTTENSHHGPTRNPHDPARVAGGSSGGSAAAVAAGVVRVALGTDTNGSVRVPAAFCGIYGLRPTYGLVPRTGVVALAPSLDTVGPLAASLADLWRALGVIAGPDGEDPTCVEAPPGTVSGEPARAPAGLRVARAAAELWDGADPAVLEAAGWVAEALSADRQILVPEVERARAAAILITAAEGADQHQELLRNRPELLDPRPRDRFLAGLSVSATDYLAAQRFRRWWQPRALEALAGTDVLVLPTVSCLPPLVGQDAIRVAGVALPHGAALGRFTQPLGLIGLPALNVPVPGSPATGGLPVGVQLVGRPFGEAALLAAARYLEASGVVRATVLEGGSSG